MCSIQTGPSCTWMRRDGVWWLGHVRADGVVHGMVVVQRRRLGSLRTAHALLLLILLPATFRRVGCSHDRIRSGLVGWVVEQCADVMHEQRVKQLCDLFLVRKIQCTFERDPAAISAPSRYSACEACNIPNPFEMHGSDFDDMSHLLALQDAISSTSSHSSNVEKFGTVDHMVVWETVNQPSESERTSHK